MDLNCGLGFRGLGVGGLGFKALGLRDPKMLSRNDKKSEFGTCSSCHTDHPKHKRQTKEKFHIIDISVLRNARIDYEEYILHMMFLFGKPSANLEIDTFPTTCQQNWDVERSKTRAQKTPNPYILTQNPLTKSLNPITLNPETLALDMPYELSTQAIGKYFTNLTAEIRAPSPVFVWGIGFF